MAPVDVYHIERVNMPDIAPAVCFVHAHSVYVCALCITCFTKFVAYINITGGLIQEQGRIQGWFAQSPLPES